MPDIQENEAPAWGESALDRFFKGVLAALPSVFIAGIFAAFSFYSTSQSNDSDIKRRMEVAEKAIESHLGSLNELQRIQQINTIRLAEISIIQQNAASQLKDLQDDQRAIKAQLQK